MSNKPKHTPGPWSYYFEGEWALVMAGGKAGNIVANVNSESCPNQSSAPAFVQMPAEANARLIAAAPDLLATLEDIVRITEISDVWLPRWWLEDARKAIAKAEAAA